MVNIEKDWLDGCIPFDGYEAKLPTGHIMPSGIDIFSLIHSWKVIDADREEGFREVRTRDLQPEDIIIGATANNGSIRAILKTYGNDAFRFQDAYGHKYSPQGWVARYGTNPFEVLAVMRKMRGEEKPFKIGGI